MYIENEANTTKNRRVYEESKLEITYLTQADVITASTDVGGEYPEIWG
jgi:hypothetical protein